jgi:hypothetical protein
LAQAEVAQLLERAEVSKTGQRVVAGRELGEALQVRQGCKAPEVAAINIQVDKCCAKSGFLAEQLGCACCHV